MSVAIRCTGITRRFGEQTALDAAGCEAPAGRFTVIVGPSGSGKTTLLRAIAGLETADAGTVHLGEQLVSDPNPVVPARDRRIGMVFQSLGLWPHLTAARHIQFVLGARGMAKDQQAAEVQRLLTLVDLPGRGGAKPAQLSGGEQQRVAIARALAGDPQVLLLDEPFGSLDAALRGKLRLAVRAIQRTLQLTTVLVTHDQEEALAVADHLVVINHGRVEQAGPATQVYGSPDTRFVAEFLGGAAVVAGTAAGGTVQCPLGPVAGAAAPDGPVQVVLRPEDLRLDGEGTAATVRSCTFGAGRYLVEVALPDGTVLRVADAAPREPDAAVRVALAATPHCIAGAD